MSAGLYSHTTRAFGTILTAEIYNDDHQKHITNHNPSMMGGLSDTVAEMQGSINPGAVGTENLADSLAGELQRIRYVINRIVGKSQWYEVPARNLDTPFADANGTFDSVTGSDQTPAVKVSGGRFFNLDWDDNLSGLSASFRIGRTSVADSVNLQVYRPNSDIVAFSIFAPTGAGITAIGGQAIATGAEAQDGSIDYKIMTPLRTSQNVTARLATRAQAEAGANTLVLMTPERTRQYIDFRIATKAQAQAGANNTVLMTPLRVQEAQGGASAGEIGTYAFAEYVSGGNAGFGANKAGSGLSPAHASGRGSGSLNGTWKCMGHSPDVGNRTLWLRVA